MKTKLFTLIIFAALVGSGCASAPKPQVVASANYGAYPSNYDAIIHTWIKSSFFDPYSIRDLKIGVPQKFWVQDPPLLGGKTHFGYMVAVALNGKNRFGAYAGMQAYQLLIRDGHVIGQQWVNQPNREVTGPEWVF